ncbi:MULTISPECIES: SMC-Scp complex subunit ScpB [Leuconostoc]|jgi:segregation and condensation protein B|uniref:SMC-Scp complex subunit ScpB n=1 Tax=Leuconostoc TaxID=1243 RepID=UPI0005A860BE|nr:MULTISPECIES: SMC-Scp complex subunit ScpB [Leuconostoc]KMY77539.1 segregation and condensation protein B [Leuconostoc mesenteroides subsp. mesenteroides]MBZ1506013.1 SMC-Scp complex subunit ScpB [Leuconostoc mesenteroides]MCM6827567.1 SMC-Scp complex subunit ScpB [Leuconostoc mesenteroides]MCT8391840.1 SMC-Scp complex subunit ScpB [Leuconostoc mesenteroides]MDN6068498.1 SMC-Scp complex subunit ScpB [Leuconostoc sp.]
MNNLSQIEALLFVSGDEGISVKNMSIITGFDRSAIQGLLEELVLKYDTDLSSALQIRKSDDVYRLVTKPELGGTVKQYFDSPVNATLSQAQLETLVIVAYKQPITRVEIDTIRGVQSSGTLQKLALRQLVHEVGRKDEPGRPIMFGTTDEFLDYFGLKSIEELPPLPDFNMLDLSDDIDGELFTSAFDVHQSESEKENV